MFQLISTLGVLSLSAMIGSTDILALGAQSRQDIRPRSDAAMVRSSGIAPAGDFERSLTVASRDRDRDHGDDHDRDDNDDRDDDCKGNRPNRSNRMNAHDQSQALLTSFDGSTASRDDDCD